MAAGAETSRSKLVGVLALVAIIAAGALIVRSLFRGPGHGASVLVYYTTDDGVTLFPDRADRVAPFDYKGRPAVRARVFSCDGNKTRFVGYLEKFDTEGAKLREDTMAKGGAASAPAGMLVKKAGAQYVQWVSMNDGGAYMDVINVTPPPGEAGAMVEVLP